MRGILNWVRVGRPLADLLVESLNFGRPVTAMALLYTLVAIALLSAVGVACASAYGIRSPFCSTRRVNFPLIDRLIPPLLDGNQTFSFSQLRLHGLDVDKHRQKSLKHELPTGCTPSSEAICTSEFSLQKVGVDGLVLQLVPDLFQQGRPGT